MNNKKARGFVVMVLLVWGGSVSARDAPYVPIPDGFDFPAAQAELLKARDEQNVTRMREHAWMVFAGMTQPAHPDNPSSEAVWETWYRGDEVFATGAQPQGARQFVRKFVPPRQLQQRGQAMPQALG